MIRILRPAVGFALAAFLLGARTALAASPPPNDTFAGATVIDSLPFADQLDTTGATTDSTDAEVAGFCDFAAIEASVWYAYTPTSSEAIVVDASASSYSVGIIVMTGAPGSFSPVTCGEGALSANLAGGETYHVLVFSDNVNVNGGLLDLSVDLLPPPPTLSVAVASTGTVNPKTGVVTITGTIDCSDESLGTISASAVPGPGFGGVEVFVDVRQNVGRIFTVTGSGGGSVSCASSVPFSIQVVPSSGLFKPGTVTATVSADYCNVAGCAYDSRTASVRIKK